MRILSFNQGIKKKTTKQNPTEFVSKHSEELWFPVGNGFSSSGCPARGPRHRGAAMGPRSATGVLK